mmetsp:Transcript_75821/g.245497  ORF Transcript_75821/g.245497 Transcript_75821/m.245497 type:complete len:241 (+) Transcript_75821:2107-2829(+)
MALPCAGKPLSAVSRQSVVLIVHAHRVGVGLAQWWRRMQAGGLWLFLRELGALIVLRTAWSSAWRCLKPGADGRQLRPLPCGRLPRLRQTGKRRRGDRLRARSLNRSCRAHSLGWLHGHSLGSGHGTSFLRGALHMLLDGRARRKRLRCNHRRLDVLLRHLGAANRGNLHGRRAVLHPPLCRRDRRGQCWRTARPSPERRVLRPSGRLAQLRRRGYRWRCEGRPWCAFRGPTCWRGEQGG